MEVTETRRIVLLGKTGVGKSSLGNTIFGENVFTVGHISNSETKECRAETRSINRRSITLIDAPGLFDTDRPEEKLKTEMVRCITECAPGPHTFLILLKVERFTEQENDIIRKICEYFSEEALKYAAVVFTHGDQLPEGMTIAEFVQQNKGLRDLVRKCGGWCHVVDKKYWNNNRPNEYRSNQFQVEKLLNTIDNIVLENNGGYYTNKMLQIVDSMIKKHGKSNVSSFLKMSAGITTGVLLGAFLGVPAMIYRVVNTLKTMSTEGTAGAVKAAVGIATIGAAAAATAIGAVKGGCIGYKEADKADSVLEAVQNTAKSVWGKYENFTQNNKKQQ